MSKFTLILFIFIVLVVLVTANNDHKNEAKKGKGTKENPTQQQGHHQSRKSVHQSRKNAHQHKSGGKVAAHEAAPKAATNKATTQKGRKVIKKQLRGVNRSGTEYSCIGGYAIFEGPTDDAAIQNMKKWNINVVRVPLNEDCWLGINGHKPAYIGENYRKAVIDYVKRLRKNNLSVIVDLHWTSGLFTGAGCVCHDKEAKCQKPMPDKEHAIEFWQSLAKEFGKDENIIFDLFNEPYPDMVYWDKKECWNCWRNGGTACSKFPYPVAGMQDLVSIVRKEKAINPLMVGGINWSSDLNMWMEHVPVDPLKKIVASWHAYAANPCNNTECWEKMIGPIAKEYSVIVGEIGETDCGHTYIDKLMAWMDQKGINYLGWTWNTWGCDSGPALITDYSGTPTKFGEGLMNHLKKK